MKRVTLIIILCSLIVVMGGCSASSVAITDEHEEYSQQKNRSHDPSLDYLLIAIGVAFVIIAYNQ